ncbi:MAG: methylmalonyl-CoA carboxyltransferase [SAR324 cluster bacterium]|nr:methylmalonyl-CoA carboxyltransferase [SAR324 cluster bacterium]MCZ6557439.1 methylmalonyl-CoA carboxyltransferase [SAR324 cluster bacterium]MCZ6730515.1 methylmalonyl-CoA carboxyltransferase [SAR324 cluster bacterium]MCZ6841579.1 methylmalonyl-CoA carboxyltransferase [SAR324 cluster bacterium]
MAHEDLLTELDERRERASAMGGAEKLAKRKERGRLNAWERLACLVDQDSFVETGLLGASGVFKEDEANTPRDGKIVGFAKVDGREVAVCVNDFTTKGASTSATNSKKMGHVRRVATEKGFPFIHVGESTGARLPDAMGARGMGRLMGNDTTQFRRFRENPWAAAALDTAFGSSAWLCCCSDFAVMKKGSIMAVSSPRLVSLAIGEKVDLEELGGWRVHAEYTGLIDRFVDTDQEAMAEIRRFLGYMPNNNTELPPQVEPAEDAGQDQRRILEVIPEKRTQVYDMRKIVQILVDRGSDFEIKPGFGKPAITTLARLGGKPVGIIANNPYMGGGALSAEACRKIIDFQVLCDSFNVPMVRLMDTPGFVVGVDAERKGAPGWIMNFMNSTSLITVPCITVIVRKAYGRAYVAMGGGRYNDEMVAWPMAEVSFMDPVFATSIVHNLSPGDEGFEEAFEDIHKENEVWDMATDFTIQNVIKPQDTREYLIRMLDVYRIRRDGGIGKHYMQSWPTSY